jgi:hypothetical protein
MDNEKLADLEPVSRLLFIYLWMLADREGRLEDRPKRIAAQALPYDRSVDVDVLLWGLHEAGFISRYVAEETPCIQILAFSKHQTPHIREAASTLPSMVQGTTKAVPEHNLGNDEASPRSPDSLIPDSLIPDSLIADSPQPSAAVRERRKRRPPAPVSEIVDLYLSNLPDLPGVVSITDKRKRHIETVHAGIMESDLDNWRGYFQAVARSDFLTGKVKDWRADFDFLIRPETPIKVLEGKYA